MKLKEVLDKSIQFFKDKKLESARLDAELLIAHALKLERMQLYIKYDSPLTDKEVSDCREVVRRRIQGEPVAYITEDKGFYGLSFHVGPGVLIPRPETEGLVEITLEFVKKNKMDSPRILDLGAGTGCIGFSVLRNIPEASLVSIEKSEAAFTYLKKNCAALELSHRCELINKNINELIPADLGHFDIVLSNPPYIANDDLQTEAMVKKFEPSEALFAEKKGYELLTSWSEMYSKYVKPEGLMAFEMGYLQGEEMKKHFQSLNIFSTVEIIKDLSGLDRIIKAIRK
ncbi:MAG: peptide chain release factor N(5)-glutamine methyltransferase [Pseudobdellovibrio sp.]